MNKKKTIIDVAKASGYSITTVSRVINGNYPVKAETRERIEAIIKEMNYSPNVLARGLIGAKTKNIGIIVPSIENYFFSQIIGSIDDVISSSDYTAFICSTHDDATLEEKHIKSLLDRQVDGIIIISSTTRQLSAIYNELVKEVPVVIINGDCHDYDCNFISSDQIQGMFDVIDYLVDQGHREIAFLRGHDTYSYDIKEEVYRKAHKKYGLKLEDSKIIRISKGNSLETAMESKDIMIKVLKQKITAVIACNDLMALGTLNAAKELNIKVPEDLRIIGFDNTLICYFSNPALSSVDQKMDELGKLAARKLLGLLNGEKSKSKHEIIKTKLVIRET